MWRRAGILIAILVSAVSCDWFAGGGAPTAVQATSDYVFVHFWGGVHVHRAPPGTQIWEDVTYQWQEVSMYRIGSGNVVQDPTRIDHLRGWGQGTGVSPLFGSCTVKYESFADTFGRPEGIRVINEGRDVVALGLAPFSMHSTSGYSGSFCRPPQDPGIGLEDGQHGVDQFSCTLGENQNCMHTAVIPPSTEPGVTETGNVTFTAVRETRFAFLEEDDWLDELLDDVLWVGMMAEAAQANAVVPTQGLGPAPADGDVSLTVSQDGVKEGTLQGAAHKGAVPQLTVTWQKQPSPTLPLEVDAVYALHGGPKLTLSQTIYLPVVAPGTPAAGGSSPSIAGVAFHGSAANPTIVVTGQNLGAEPAASPAGHPSGQGGCPAVAGDDGYDYGTSLYIAIPSGNWSIGRYNPSLGETDCFDLVVSKFTDTEIDFSFGPLYTQQTKDQLTAGTAFQLVVNGATYTGTVAYT